MADVDMYVVELEVVAAALGHLVAQFDTPEVKGRLDALENSVNAVERSWSGSNLGYHARVYYRDFEIPSPGAMFDPAYGLIDDNNPYLHRNKNWVLYDENHVRAHVLSQAGDVDLTELHTKGDAARAATLRHKATITSILASCLTIREDPYLSAMKTDVENVNAPNAIAFARSYVPSGQAIITIDGIARNQGLLIAPHQLIRGEAEAIDAPYLCARALLDHAANAVAHLQRQPDNPPMVVAPQLGSRIFIGHGRSHQWRELKDYIQDQLRLPVDEFNRVPAAGFTTIARLNEMLESAAMAFLVMTAEDETPDGGYRARQNVVHEVGLFQGRLGFDRAIVMVEEGCEDFSNIHGLIQVHYPADNISAKFHEVHALLEREELI